MLASLAREGVVEQVPGDTRYRLGGRIVSLAAGVLPARSLVAIARPILVELASATGEAAGLSVPDGASVHYIDQVDTTHQVQIRDWTGTRAADACGVVRPGLPRPHERGRDRALPGAAAGRVHADGRSPTRPALRERLRRSSSTASPGSARSSPRASPSRRRSPARTARSWPRSTSTARPTAFPVPAWRSASATRSSSPPPGSRRGSASRTHLRSSRMGDQAKATASTGARARRVRACTRAPQGA